MQSTVALLVRPWASPCLALESVFALVQELGKLSEATTAIVSARWWEPLMAPPSWDQRSKVNVWVYGLDLLTAIESEPESEGTSKGVGWARGLGLGSARATVNAWVAGMVLAMLVLELGSGRLARWATV